MPLSLKFRYTTLLKRQSCSRLPRHLSHTHVNDLQFNCFRHSLIAKASHHLAAMAPKQATLGYVKSSQTTLWFGDTSHFYLESIVTLLIFDQ